MFGKRPRHQANRAADLQFSAAIPVARYVEYLTPCAYIEELPTSPFKIDAEGYLEISTTPGLGIDIDEKLAAKYPVSDEPPFDFRWGTTRRRDGTVIRP